MLLYMAVINLLIFICVWDSIAWLHHNLSIYSSIVDGLWALYTSEYWVYKYLVYVSWYTCAYISAGCKPRSGMRMSDFNRYCQIASKVAGPIYTPTISMWQFSLLQICSKTWIVSHFNFSPPGGGVVITHCDFNLYFSWLFMRFSSISYVYWSVDLLFKVITVQAYCPFPTVLSVFLLLIYRCYRYELLVKGLCCKYLLLFCSWHFHSLNSILWCTEQKLFILIQSNISVCSFMDSFISCLRRFLLWGHEDTLLYYTPVVLCFPI